MKSIFKTVEKTTVQRLSEGIRPSLRGKYAEMMKDIYTIYVAYAMEEGVRPESEGVVRQMIFDQAMSQFSNHDPVIRLPVGGKAECELDMSSFTVEQIAEIAHGIRSGEALPAESDDQEAETIEDKVEETLGTDEGSAFGDLLEQ